MGVPSRNDLTVNGKLKITNHTLRLQKMRMRLQHYDFRIVAKRGTEIPAADALSRADLPDEGDRNVFKERLEQVQIETSKDESLLQLILVINNPDEWPETRKEVHPKVRLYLNFQEELRCIERIVFKGERIIILKAMRKHVLNVIHESHLAMVKCKQLARDIVYWSGINKEIEEMVMKCAVCQQHLARQ